MHTVTTTTVDTLIYMLVLTIISALFTIITSCRMIDLIGNKQKFWFYFYLAGIGWGISILSWIALRITDTYYFFSTLNY